MATRRGWGGRGPLLATCLALALGGCDLEVFNPGAITEDSLNDPALMGVVVNGVANEFNQLVETFSFQNARLSDEMAGSGSYFETGTQRRGSLDWDETAAEWGQLHETIWTGQQAWARMLTLDDYDQDTSADAARAWTMVGFSHRFFGENFCEVIYSTDVEGGGPVQARTAAFDSAIVAFDRAITIGTAAGTPAASFVTAARAGLAQAYMGKGDFATAVTYSVQVPTAFHMDAAFNITANQNQIFDETWDRNEIGVFGTYAARIATKDPRAPFTECGTFDNPADPKNSTVSATGATGCTSARGADGITAHYRQDKYAHDGADIPYATGLEMRMIEAEHLLRQNQLAAFTDTINHARNFVGLPDIAVPGAAGALEYPNAYDASTGSAVAGANSADVDGWSILDGERWLSTWLEGRRLWDLHRWDHPFLDGGIVFWDSEVRRASCWPVPELECTLNRNISGSSLSTGVGAGTQTCG